MKRGVGGWILFLAACAAPAPPVPAPDDSPEGAAFTGDPGRPGHAATVYPVGMVEVDDFRIAHNLFDPATGNHFSPVSPKQVERSLFREILPFPQHKWYGGKFEVTQLVFPARGGFVLRYQLTNHGDAAQAIRLYVGVLHSSARRQGPAIVEGGRTLLYSVDPPGAGETPKRYAGAFPYELTVEPGASKFAHVATVDLEGENPTAALEAAAARWQPLVSTPRVSVPDPGFLTAHALELAATHMKLPGSEDALAKRHETLVRREGDALKLFPGAPAAWLVESIAVESLPTPFGPLTYRFLGGEYRWSLELGDGCRPPGGFIIPLKVRMTAQADGRDVPAEPGAVRVPAGARRVELTRVLD